MMDELTGTYTLVHPDLPYDPAERQGQIGLITFADLKSDEVYVSFGKEAPALYSTDALQVLKTPVDIYKHLMNDAKDLQKDDYKTLFEINLLQNRPGPEHLQTALQLARDNEAVRKFSMVTLDQKLGIELSRPHEMEPSVPVARGR